VSPAGRADDELAQLRQGWLLCFILGLVSLLVGITAISSYFIAALATMIIFGVLLLIAGATEVIHALMVRNGKGFAVHLLAAALYLVVGVFMLEDPIRAAEVIALLLAANFYVAGALRVIFSIAVRFPAWGWVLLHGTVDLLLGVMIFSGWPESSLRIIGLLVGIDLVLHGWSWMILALTVRTSREGLPA
jgi:uncharacterized membrane protein HdeD (DUF308 family)